MKLKIIFILFLFAVVLFSTETIVQAEETNYFDSKENYKRENLDIQAIFKKAIDDKVFTVEDQSYSAWLQLEKNFLWPNYNQVKQENLTNPLTSYEQWLEENHYGIVADIGSEFIPVMQARSTADNKRQFMNTIHKGDFVVVSDVREPWSPFIGHAAIATTNNWILDMPGYKDGNYTKEDNNRQLQKGDWFNKYQSAWTTIYRVKTSQQVRNDIADWADWRYWSSSHGLTKNRHVTYSLDPRIKNNYDRAFCSKLVWQALYYGSGDVPLVIPRPAIFPMFPYMLPGEMNTNYTPTKYGPF
ncbi:hypothetical protein HWQ72_001060 [Listeria monocytogenes]|nr:hypothetical protein [Listeria monocytogenes]EFS8542113.1 hypothetical protein [Listeria monocytogenes]